MYVWYEVGQNKLSSLDDRAEIWLTVDIAYRHVKCTFLQGQGSISVVYSAPPPHHDRDKV